MPSYILTYVYELSDFETTGGNIAPPNEQGAQAQGSPPFRFQVKIGSTYQSVQINDADTVFGEIDSTGQELANLTFIDGVPHSATSNVLVNYVLEDAAGNKVYSITIGANNTGNNTTTALVSEVELTPGVQYTFVSEGNIGNSSVDYLTIGTVACFVKGTRIATETGEVRIEALQPGDRVVTLDHGLQPVRMVASRRMQAAGACAPIVISKGALGNEDQLIVSPNHRILISGAMAELVLGMPEVLVAAKHLINGDTIYRSPGLSVHYFHLILDRHEIVFSNGIPTESFFLGDVDAAVSVAGEEQRAELLAIFPELETGGSVHPELVRQEVRKFEAQVLLS